MTVAELIATLSAYRSATTVVMPDGSPVAGATMFGRDIRLIPSGDNDRQLPPEPYVSKVSQALTSLQPGDTVDIPKPSSTTMGYIGWLTKKYPGRRFKTSRIDQSNTKVWRIS